MRGSIRTIVALAIFVATTLTLGCASKPPAPPSPGRLVLQVIPNPILAYSLENEQFEFDFEIVVREEGGSDVAIDRVSADVIAFGGLRIASRTLDADELEQRGYATRVEANRAIRYRFKQRHDVPDERLLTSVTAEVFIEGTDALGNPTTARTSVSVDVAK